MNASSAVDFPGTHRIHLALAVGDLQRSRAFYATLLGVEPSQVRSDYLQFEPEAPSVNLSLNQVGAERAPARPPAHYGIQVRSSAEVHAAQQRLSAAGLATRVEQQTDCCYAVQDKVWVEDPDGNAWEVFVVTRTESESASRAASACC